MKSMYSDFVNKLLGVWTIMTIAISSSSVFLYARENGSAIARHPRSSYAQRKSFQSPAGILDKWLDKCHLPKDHGRYFYKAHGRHHDITGREGEFILDTNWVYGPSVAYEESPEIVFDGTNYLLVWSENDFSGYYHLYGSRITSEGVLIDSGHVGISTNMEHGSGNPAITCDGSNSLVVFDTPSSDSDWTYDIYGVRVDANGQVLDTLGIPISTAVYDQSNPCVAFDGTNYMIAWMDDRDGDYIFDIYCARVSPSGTVLDPSGIMVATGGWNSKPSIAFDGTNYLVVWRYSLMDTLSFCDSLYGARINQAGVVLDPNGIKIGTGSSETAPDVVFGNTNYFTVWERFDTLSYECEVIGTRITPAGSVIDTAGIIISAGHQDNVTTALDFDGTNFMVLWQTLDTLYWSNDIYGSRVSQSGVVLDPSGIVVSDNIDEQYDPAIAYGNNTHLAVWSDYRSQNSSDIYGARITTSGVVLDTSGINYSLSTNTQYLSTASFDGANYLVAWDDCRNIDGSSDIYGVRVNTSGTVLDPASFAISSAPNYQDYPDAAFDGTNHLVVWEDLRNSYQPDIYGARVSSSGTVLDPSGIAIADGGNWQNWPALAHGTVNYFAVWTEQDTFTYECDIYGARVTPAGSVLDPNGIRLSNSGYAVDISSVAFDGTNFFVAWTCYDTINYCYDIYGTRVSQSGTVLDPAGIPIATADGDQSWPSIAFDGTNYLVTWHDFGSGMFSMIYGTRVSTTGVVLDPSGIAISVDTVECFMPRAAFDGTNHVITWMSYDFVSNEFHLHGAKVSPSGSVISRFPVVVQAGNQMYPSLARGQGNQMLLTYSGWTDAVNGRPVNTYRIWGKMYPFPGVEESSAYPARQASSALEIQPNPAKGIVRIGLGLENIGPWIKGTAQKDPSVLSLKIYDASGRLVRDLSTELDDRAPAINWNGDDDSGRKLPAGIYFVKLTAGTNMTVKKMVLIR